MSFTWESQKSLISFSFHFSFRGFKKKIFPLLTPLSERIRLFSGGLLKQKSLLFLYILN